MKTGIVILPQLACEICLRVIYPRYNWRINGYIYDHEGPTPLEMENALQYERCYNDWR